MSLATRENQAGASFGDPKNVLEFQKMIQLSPFLRRQNRFLLFGYEFFHSGLRCDGWTKTHHSLRCCFGGDKVYDFQIYGVESVLDQQFVLALSIRPRASATVIISFTVSPGPVALTLLSECVIMQLTE